ncbi:Rod shape-determining protein MreB [Dissulfuribacter thermophilus]|uniref:Cell shape-determining protein MreB n=1 Tax=Dissulfuribacter thermophilus TaxID=1156395 RepID=A0A1B9F8U4_9BACT|nr:rod shape-determining protein [Dissulfuribacter thermophilus]OCC16368.1 Rod shape-determining protein MreB [Dissulfuribacter thermophilus]
MGLLRSIVRKDLAMDLGTANTLVYVAGDGIVLNEPTCIEIDHEGTPVCFGENAYERLGKTPDGQRVIRPLKHGVINDFEAATALVRNFIKKAKGKKGILPPRVLISVPSKMTQLEKRSVLEAARAADIKDPYLIEETMAAAIGAGLEVFETHPRMVVDIGGGTTEVAVIERGGFVESDSIRIAGDEMDEAIKRFMKQTLGIHIGSRSAERIKCELGTAVSDVSWDESISTVTGKDLNTGLPKIISISAADLRPALLPILDEIAYFIRDFIGILPERVRDIIKTDGFLLTGGGTLLKGIDRYLAQETGMPVCHAPQPLLTVAKGAGLAIENLKIYRGVFSN